MGSPVQRVAWVVALCAAFLLAPIVLSAASPQGSFDQANSGTCTISGWARDPDTTNSISVRILRDGPEGSGTLLVQTVANQLRTDLSFTDKNHGFSYQVPLGDQLYDNNNHTIYVYAVDSGSDPNTLLGNKTIKCNYGTVFIYAPQTQLIVGQSMQLQSSTRDFRGNTRGGVDPITWTTSDNNVLSIDANGQVTAKKMGLVTITANWSGFRNTVLIQVLPLRVDLVPLQQDVLVGDTVQFKAIPRDINEGASPDPGFSWQLTGATGNNTQAATINSSGLFRALAEGIITVRAVFNYPVPNSQLVQQYVQLGTVNIRVRKDYKLSRVLAGWDLRDSFHLRPNHRVMAANDAGQVAFVGSLDGMVSALMLYDKGQLQVLSTSGSPGPQAGGVIKDFFDVSLNNRGDVLARAGFWGTNWGLWMVAHDGTTYAPFIDGSTAGGASNITNSSINRYSLGDNGDIVFRANFNWLIDPTTQQSGLIYLSQGAFNILISSSDPLPGLQGTVQFDQNFGLAGNGVVFFEAFDSSNRGLYRIDNSGSITKVLRSGDTLSGSVISGIGNLTVSRSGDVAVVVYIVNGSPEIVYYPGGNITAAPQIHTVNWMDRLEAVNKAGVLWLGDDGCGGGLCLFKNGSGIGSSTAVQIYNRLGPSDEPVTQFDDAFLNSSGDVYVQHRTQANSFVVGKYAASNSMLFKAGQPVNQAVNLGFFSLVPGSKQTPPLVGTNNDYSFFDISTNIMVPRMVAGDRPAGGPVFLGSGYQQQSLSGDLYFSGEDGLYHLPPGSGAADNLLRFPITIDSSVSLQYSNNRLAVNDKGQAVTSVWTNINGHGRLVFLDGGKITTIAQVGLTSDRQTPSPSGGVFSSWNNDMALNAAGEVMAYINVTGGPSGYFLYSGGKWTATVLLNQTQVGGFTVSFFRGLKTNGTSFYALFGLTGSTSVLCVYSGGAWTPVVSRGDAAPNGSAVNDMFNFDVNRNGDLVWFGNLQGVNTIQMRAASGQMRTVLLTNRPTDAGDNLSDSLFDLVLLDDRRVYFTMLDVFGQEILYVANPIF